MLVSMPYLYRLTPNTVLAEPYAPDVIQSKRRKMRFRFPTKSAICWSVSTIGSPSQIPVLAENLNPNLLMMQPAQDWNGRDAAHRLLGSEKRRVLANERLLLRCGGTHPAPLIRWYHRFASLCHDTLIASFNSLMSLKLSLLLKINSLFRILGNFGKKHRRLLRFLTSRTPNYARNRSISLDFPW